MRDDSMLTKIVQWAQGEPEIRVVILEGSRASDCNTDALSDYDLNVFVTDGASFTSNNHWITIFDDVLVYQKEKFFHKNIEIPTRLVVYENSPKVDFSFWPIEMLHEIVDSKTLPEHYRNGYKVLLDKDNITQDMPAALFDGFVIGKPTKDEVLTTIYNFWFETYCIVKYLKRNSLWYAKVLENGPIKRFLLQMILWHESSKDDWKNNKIHLEGKNLEGHLDEDIRRALAGCFSRYNKEDTWRSLCKMTELFKKLSREVAAKLSIEYPGKSVAQIETYIRQLYNG